MSWFRKNKENKKEEKIIKIDYYSKDLTASIYCDNEEIANQVNCILSSKRITVGEMLAFAKFCQENKVEIKTAENHFNPYVFIDGEPIELPGW